MLNSPLRRLRFIGFCEGVSYLVLLLVAVIVAGLLSAVVATRTALRGRMLDALRAE